MPTERFTDEMLSKFIINHRGPTSNQPRWRDGARGWYVTPNRTHERSRALECSPDEWGAVLRLSKEGGLHVSGQDPFTTDQVRHLRRAITAAVVKKPIEDPGLKAWVDRFLAFISGDGQFGFTLSREWRRIGGR